MGRPLLLPLLASLLFASGPWAQAVEDRCVQWHLNEMALLIEPEAYDKSSRILILSDGAPGVDFTLGDKIADKFPQKLVVSGDLYEGYARPRPNWERIHVDNTKPFPFSANAFDTVVLRKGLCVCKLQRCCGGFEPISIEAKRFFRETVRVLDKTGPNPMVVLQGGNHVTPRMVRAWRSFLSEIEQEFGVIAALHFDNDGEFVYVSIRTK